MQLPKNLFKQKLQSGETQLGIWLTSTSNIVAEVVGDSEYDWVCIDTEHTPNELRNVIQQMQAMQGGMVSPWVRPAWNDTVLIKRLLDQGAQTLLIPFVENEAEATSAVSATRYPPAGIRGVTGAGRAARYGRVKEYLHTAEQEICVIVQIETIGAMGRLEEIAAVEGVDAVFIGPSDLSASMGHLGNAAHEEVQAAIANGIARLNQLGVPAGILAFNPEVAKQYIEMGFKFVAVASDLSLLRAGLTGLHQQF